MYDFVNSLNNINSFLLAQFLTEDKLSQCQTSLVKLEKELGAERERCQDLEERIQELEAVSATQQSTLRAKQEQVDVLQVSHRVWFQVEQLVSSGSMEIYCKHIMWNSFLFFLQSEIGKLRQIIDGQKQQLGGKLKKSAQEFKQQL